MGRMNETVQRYARKLHEDGAYRTEWCENTGLGFELGELGYSGLAPIARHSSRKSILRHVLEIVAGADLTLRPSGYAI
jgi:hypothetical protein